MKAFCVVLIMLTLTACSSGRDNTEKRVFDFYAYYLNIFASSEGKITPNPKTMREYVSCGTLSRIDTISNIYEQEIISSDYYTYAQDYSQEWIPRLKVGKSKDFLGGKYIDVWLGREDNQTYQLGVYLKKENETWKIYRVKNISINYEQYIFDKYAIERARKDAKNINN
ncbi:YbjP/YqhG family protein [Kluyvera ascorbata]|uniref:YbjP/YqhG family protein n=1 Tax=Kluyvera ascorbata TaxID=51288 RepID=UPI00356AA1DB